VSCLVRILAACSFPVEISNIQVHILANTDRFPFAQKLQHQRLRIDVVSGMGRAFKLLIPNFFDSVIIKHLSLKTIRDQLTRRIV